MTGSELRMPLFALGAVGLGALLVWGMLGLHPVGGYAGAYGATLNQVAVGERHATDVVTAVNFDYRGFDTLGEELILFTSVVGTVMLLRRHPDEREEKPKGDEDEAARRRVPPTSDAMRVLAVALTGTTVVFGLYLATHGTVSPGGGFQGGVVLATAPLVVYLASDVKTFTRVAPEAIVESAEAIGAAGYAAVGVLAFFFAKPFLENVLPLGKPGDVLSGGTMFVISVLVGLEVGAGFVVLLLAFLREALEIRSRSER